MAASPATDAIARRLQGPRTIGIALLGLAAVEWGLFWVVARQWAAVKHISGDSLELVIAHASSGLFVAAALAAAIFPSVTKRFLIENDFFVIAVLILRLALGFISQRLTGELAVLFFERWWEFSTVVFVYALALFVVRHRELFRPSTPVSPSGNSKLEQSRDPALDALRAISLILMIVAHFGHHFEVESPEIFLLWQVGEAAPAAFFFCFGMTYAFYARKDPRTRLSSDFVFLCIALTHNLYVDKTMFSMNFLMLLFVWRALAGWVLKPIRLDGPKAATWIVIAGIFVILWLPDTNLESFVGGKPFHFHRWALYCFAGVAAWEYRRSRRLPVLAMTLVVAGIAGHLYGTHHGIAIMRLVKWDCTPTYFALTLSIALLLWRLLQTSIFEALTRRMPWIALWSKNLLLGTVLHYVAHNGVWKGIEAAVSPVRIAGHEIEFYVAGVLASCVVLHVLLRLTTRLWSVAESMPVWTLIVDRFVPVAMGSILIASLMQIAVFGWTSKNAFGIDVYLLLMLVFALLYKRLDRLFAPTFAPQV